MVLYKEIDEFSEMPELEQSNAKKIKTRVAKVIYLFYQYGEYRMYDPKVCELLSFWKLDDSCLAAEESCSGIFFDGAGGTDLEGELYLGAERIGLLPKRR